MDKVWEALKILGGILLGCATIALTLFYLIYSPLDAKITNNCTALSTECGARALGDNTIKDTVGELKTILLVRTGKIYMKLGIPEDGK